MTWTAICASLRYHRIYKDIDEISIVAVIYTIRFIVFAKHIKTDLKNNIIFYRYPVKKGPGQNIPGRNSRVNLSWGHFNRGYFEICCQNWSYFDRGHFDRGHFDRGHVDLDSYFIAIFILLQMYYPNVYLENIKKT